MKITNAGLDLIKSFESLELDAYPDPATGGDPITIGYGHTGPEVQLGMSITAEQADEYLREDVAKFEQCVEAAVGAFVMDEEFSACVSLAFNIGCRNFQQSTLVRMIRAGNMVGASNEFLRWDRAAGKVMPGLTRRRKAERELFLS